MANIFLDYNSTTPVDPEVLEEMKPYFLEKYGNASSRNHPFGWEAKDGIDKAKSRISSLINCQDDDLVFTSGATESINLGLLGIFASNNKGHIISVKTEHKAVLDTIEHLSTMGVTNTLLDVDSKGIIDTEKIISSIRNDTKLIAVMHANNEIGVIQDIEQIGSIAHDHDIPFFVDAAQSVGKIPIDVKKMNVDLLAFSAHKFYGPKGVGGLFINNKLVNSIVPQIYGGGHQMGIRSGTLNVPGIVGMGKAAEICKYKMREEGKRLKSFRTRFLELLDKKINGYSINGDLDARLSGNINISFNNVDGDALLSSLADIGISNGSACTSEKTEPSHVLKALGIPNDLANASIRICFGRQTKKSDIVFSVNRISEEVLRIRNMSKLATKMASKW